MVDWIQKVIPHPILFRKDLTYALRVVLMRELLAIYFSVVL